MPFELRPEPHPTLPPEGEYFQRAWSQSVYPIARKMGVPINLPPVSPQPHTHLAFEGYQYAKQHGKGNEYNHRVLTAVFVERQDIGQIDVLTRLAGEVGLSSEIQEGEQAVSTREESVYYTARHLLQALSNLDESLLDLPLVLVHGKELNKPNLVSGIIPSPIPVDRTAVEVKKPSLLALADLR
jgi:hypothetical protein